MAKTVRVPDPVYERIEREAENEDVSHGTIVRDWMERADQYEQTSEAIHR